MAIDPNNLSGAAMTFDEEFNSLDFSKWNPDYFWQSQGGYYSNNTTWIVNPNNPATASLNPFSVNNGVLTISANPTPDGASGSVGGSPYTSGLLTTYGTFSQTYGYFEMRAQFPSGAGLESDFWMEPASGTATTPELDVVELPSAWPTTTTFAIHDNQLSGGITGGWADVADSSNGFHTYGVDWEPDYTTWYVDGKQVYQAPTPSDMNVPEYLILDLQVGSRDSWPGSPNGNTPFPAQLKVDYIRAYSSMPGNANANAQAATTSNNAPSADSASTGSASPASNNASGGSSSDGNSSNSTSSSGGSGTTLTVQDDNGTSATVPIITGGSSDFTGPLATTVQQSVSNGTDTVSVQSPVNMETVQLGDGNQSLSFLSPNALVLTGGSGTDTVTADSGPNRNVFTAGTGTLDVTGGSDGSTYAFHDNSGQMIIEDFGFYKGDTIAVSQDLQGGFSSGDDGQGGSLLTFANGGSIDVKGQAGLAASQINWT